MMMMVMSQMQEVEEIDISDDEPVVRRLGEEGEIDSGADVALLPLSMAVHGEGELEFSTKTKGNRIPTGGARSVEISLRDLDGREVLLKENVIFSSKVNQPILCYGRLMEHGWESTRANVREWWLESTTQLAKSLFDSPRPH